MVARGLSVYIFLQYILQEKSVSLHFSKGEVCPGRGNPNQGRVPCSDMSGFISPYHHTAEMDSVTEQPDREGI